jgi:hypothetical protein
MADHAIDLQEQILEAQKEAAGFQAAAAAATADTSAAMAALNAQALPYYEWAESEGERLYALQRQQHQEQLDAITGGMEVNLFIASKQAEAVDELKEIRRLLAAWAAANPASARALAGLHERRQDAAGPGWITTGGGDERRCDGWPDVMGVIKRNASVGQSDPGQRVAMAIPTEHASREYLAFLRIPASVAMFSYAACG